MPLTFGEDVGNLERRRKRAQDVVNLMSQAATHDERSSSTHQRGERPGPGHEHRSGQIRDDQVGRREGNVRQIRAAQVDVVADPVARHVLAGVGQCVLVEIEGVHLAGPEAGCRNGQDTGSGARVDHAPPAEALPLQERKTQPRRLVMTGAEAGRGLDDHGKRVAVLGNVPRRGDRQAPDADPLQVGLRPRGPVLVRDLDRAHEQAVAREQGGQPLGRRRDRVAGVEKEAPDRRVLVAELVDRGGREVGERAGHQVRKVAMGRAWREPQLQRAECGGHDGTRQPKMSFTRSNRLRSWGSLSACRGLNLSGGVTLASSSIARR